MKKTIAKILDALMILLVVAILGMACTPYHKMTGKQTVEYNNKQYKKFNAYKKP
jgi:hypothetical protein